MEIPIEDFEDEGPKISIVGSIVVSPTAEAVFTARSLSLAIEETLILDESNLVLLRGHRYGLVGENGAQRFLRPFPLSWFDEVAFLCHRSFKSPHCLSL